MGDDSVGRDLCTRRISYTRHPVTRSELLTDRVQTQAAETRGSDVTALAYVNKGLVTAAAELVAALRALEVHTAAFSQHEAHLTLRAVCNKNEPVQSLTQCVNIHMQIAMCMHVHQIIRECAFTKCSGQVNAKKFQAQSRD